MRYLLPLVLLVSTFAAQAKTRTLIRDDFDNNNNSWLESTSETASAKLRNGHYILSHKMQDGSYHYCKELEDFNGVDDFEIEARIKQTTGVDNSGYGFTFGFEDTKNYYAFAISSTQQFNIYGFSEGALKDWSGWITNKSINQMSDYNILKLVKTKGRYLFYVNGSLVHAMSPKNFFGNKIGFVMNNQMDIEVDYVKVEQTTIQIRGLNKGDDLPESEYVINEDFSDNKLGWPTKNDETSEAIVKNGHYELKYKSSRGSFYSWVPGDILIENDDDFYCEVKIKQLSGPDNRGYGFSFGMKDANNNYNFEVSSNGFFRIFGWEKGFSFTVQDWQKAKIKEMNEYNLLGVRKKGDYWHFYLNGQNIYSTYSRVFLGQDFGLLLSANMRIQVDDFKIIRPKKVLNLVKGDLKGSEKINLGRSINSEHRELGPLVSPDGKILYFFRDNHPENLGGQKMDIWVSKKGMGSEWGTAENIGFPLNNELHNFVVSVSPDNNSLLVGNSYKADGSADSDGISITHKIKGGWGIPKRVEIENEYNGNKYMNYCLSPDNKTLISAVERADTEGDMDLYVSFKKPGGSWTEPITMGPVVNTAGQETTPFIAADGKTVYFSSNGFAGYGDNDIYITKRLDDTWQNWTEPKNLGPEINSAAWDAYYSMPASGDVAYLVSNNNSIGESDIFSIKLAESAKPEPVLLVKGTVYDDATGQGIGTRLTVRDLATDIEVAIANSDPDDGSYEIVLPQGGEYAFYANEEGFYAVRENVDLIGLEKYQEAEVDLHLKPIVIGESIKLNNVFFVRSKPDIKSTSFAELDNLVRLLQENTSLEIEIEGHTDDIGDEELNQELSEQRVEKVLEYLVKKGVSKNRLSGKGYGGSKPVADNNYEATRKLNRRVEFKIIKY